LDEIRAVNETAIYDSRALLASITLISQTRWVLSTCCGNKTIKGNNITPLPFNNLVIQRFPNKNQKLGETYTAPRKAQIALELKIPVAVLKLLNALRSYCLESRRGCFTSL